MKQPKSLQSAITTGPQSIRMHDIAAASGYSRATVSAVLNGKIGVSARARRRIEACVAHFQYRPNPLATALQGQRSRLVGVILRDLANPYFTELFSAFEAVLSARGFQILYYNTHEDPRREREAVEELVAYQVAGLIITPIARGVALDHLQLILNRKLPCLSLERIPGLGIRCVDFDNAQAGQLAARHLYQQGHRHVCCLIGPPHIHAAEQRARGFRSFFAAQGGRAHVQLLNCGSTMQEGYAAAAELFQATATKPTALFCFSDFVAIGAYKAAHSLGLLIPRDMSLIGCDNIAMSEVLGPALTTIDFGIEQCGELVATSLIKLIEQTDEVVPLRRVMKPRLVERDSVAPCTARPAPRG